MFMCLFFVPLNPIASLIQFICFFFYYFVEKFLVLNIYSNPIQFNPRVANRMTYFPYLPLFYASSKFMFGVIKFIHELDAGAIANPG